MNTYAMGAQSARFGKRPLFFAAVCFLSGILASRFLSPPPILWAFIALLLTLAALLACPCRRAAGALVLCAFVLAGLLGGHNALTLPPELPGEHTVTARVLQVEEGAYLLEDVSIDGEPFPRRVALRDFGGAGFAAGDTLHLRSTLSVPQPPRYTFGYDDALSCAARGIGYRATLVEGKVTGHVQDVYTFAEAARSAISSRMDELFGVRAPLAKALILGQTEALSEGTSLDFRTSGISHILALSGLHIAVIAGLIGLLLRLLPMGSAGRFLLTLLLLAAYILLTGLRTSAVRAGVMAGIALYGHLRGRRNDSLTGLAAAFFALTLGNPAAVFDLSFQMSFGAVFGVLCLGSPSPCGGFSGRLCAAARASLGATLGSLPMTLGLQNRFWLPSIPLNIAAVAYAGVLIPAVFLSTLLYCLFPVQLFLWLGGFVNWLLLGLEWLSRAHMLLPQLILRVASGPALAAVFPFFALFFISKYVIMERRQRVALFACLLACFAFSLAHPASSRALTIDFLDVGKGDCAIITTASGKTALVDTGSGEAAAVFLQKRARQPDMIFLTREKTDHTGGLSSLLDSGPAIVAPPAVARGVALKYGVSVQKAVAGDSIALDADTYLRILTPAGYAEDADAGQMAMMLVYQGQNLCLFASDLTAEQELLLGEDVGAYILKAARHGKRTASNRLFVQRVHPAFAIVSSGSPAEVAFSGLRTYQTCENGTITATVSDGKLIMECMYESR